VSSTRTGRRSRAVPLDQDDPRVIAAQQAERRLYDYYGLEPTHHPVALPAWGCGSASQRSAPGRRCWSYRATPGMASPSPRCSLTWRVAG